MFNNAQVFSNGYTFAAPRADGSVVTWGDGDSAAVAAQLASGVVSGANNVFTADVVGITLSGTANGQ